MKKSLMAGALFVLSLFISSGAGAITVTIDDDPGGATTYYGAQINGGFSKVDVLAPTDVTLFNIESLTATQSGGFTTVVLSGDYFGIHGDGTNRDEGDLYINTNGLDHVRSVGPPPQRRYIHKRGGVELCRVIRNRGRLPPRLQYLWDFE